MCQGNKQQWSETVTQLSGPKTHWFVRIKMETASLHWKDSWFELLFVCNRSNLLSLPFLPSLRLDADLVTLNMDSSTFPAADSLYRQEGFYIPPHIRAEGRQRNNKMPAIVIKRHLPGNILRKRAMHACFRKISFNILNLFTSFPSVVYFACFPRLLSGGRGLSERLIYGLHFPCVLAN